MSYLTRAIGALGFLVVLALNAARQADPPRVMVECHVDRIKDGDTGQVDIILPFPPGLILEDQDCRFQGYDAWESSKRRTAVRVTDEEVRKGKIAAAALTELAANADKAYLAPVAEGQFSYGRQEGYLILWDDGKEIDVAAWMKSHGHCRPEEPQ